MGARLSVWRALANHTLSTNASIQSLEIRRRNSAGLDKKAEALVQIRMEQTISNGRRTGVHIETI